MFDGWDYDGMEVCHCGISGVEDDGFLSGWRVSLLSFGGLQNVLGMSRCPKLVCKALWPWFGVHVRIEVKHTSN